MLSSDDGGAIVGGEGLAVGKVEETLDITRYCSYGFIYISLPYDFLSFLPEKKASAYLELFPTNAKNGQKTNNHLIAYIGRINNRYVLSFY